MKQNIWIGKESCLGQQISEIQLGKRKGFSLCQIEVTIEYNTDTSAQPLSNKSEDIVRTTDII